MKCFLSSKFALLFTVCICFICSPRAFHHPVFASQGVTQNRFGDFLKPPTPTPTQIPAVGPRIPNNQKPNTDGTKKNKYIEIDISQQKMYLFEKGVLKKSYRVSTGLYYPTPTGVFTIFNKNLNAYSSIYHVWMAYWMAFYIDPYLKASFGIHELPYWYDASGKKKFRPRDFIGSPHTGGCVALDIGKAQEVYAFADVGTSVYIFD